MYGSWFGVTMGAAGVLLFIVAAALTAWTPLFALAIFAAIGTVLLVLAAMRRSAEDAPGTGTHRGDPQRYAAPASGEGGEASEPPGGSEASEPAEPESAGVWGERRA
ncbi:MAG TPA: hypothetical protein VEK39_11670 [Solirubrobacterales bacterium]|nr:hypothetical protein [Solirubrobacterales bacterium]